MTPASFRLQARPVARSFLSDPRNGGKVLMLAAAAALAAANSPWGPAYLALLHAEPFGVSLLHAINDGLMVFFFLLVGLELKRELIEGELAAWPRRALPAVAALGGMLIPALIYAAVAGSGSALRGWAIPAATDIAFALGVLALLGRRVPASLGLFLTGLAIMDDLGAVLVIALFYVERLDVLALGGAAITFAALCAWTAIARSRLTPYLIGGAILWWLVLRSGVHATIAGVLLAFAIPSRPSPSAGALKHAAPARRLEHGLQPWVTFGVVPVFGFANAGVDLSGLSEGGLGGPVTLGVLLGLLVGKQAGVFLFAWASIRLGLAARPRGATWRQLYGVSVLCGIGFTMSLFISVLAFADEGRQTQAKIGVVLGSALSALLGAALLWRTGEPVDGRAASAE